MNSRQLITMEIPMHPAGKGRARSSRKTGTMYTPAATWTTETYIMMTAAKAMEGKDIARGLIRLSITSFRSIPKGTTKKRLEEIEKFAMFCDKKPDADNITKSVMDALNGIVWLDDKQVVQLAVNKLYTTGNPRTLVVASELVANE